MFNKIFIALLSVLGIVAMSYLLWLHYVPVDSSNVGGICAVGENISCLDVNKSAYSQIFGIPLSFLGLLYFSAVFVTGFFQKLPKKFYWLLTLGTIVLLGPSFYLTYIEIAVLQKLCLYCELSKLSMITIAYLAWRQSDELRPSASEFFVSIAGAILLAMLTFYVQV